MWISINKIPNILTLLRFFIVILIVFISSFFQVELFYASKNNYDKIHSTISINHGILVVLILFILGAITDWLDGYFARKYNAISDFGKIMDPIADKLLIYSVMSFLIITNSILGFYMILFLFRDLLITISRKHLLNKNKVSFANIYGKIKTITHFLSLMFILFVILILTHNNNTIIVWNSENHFWYIIFNIILLLPLLLAYQSLWYYLPSYIKNIIWNKK